MTIVCSYWRISVSIHIKSSVLISLSLCKWLLAINVHVCYFLFTYFPLSPLSRTLVYLVLITVASSKHKCKWNKIATLFNWMMQRRDTLILFCRSTRSSLDAREKEKQAESDLIGSRRYVSECDMWNTTSISLAEGEKKCKRSSEWYSLIWL